MKHSLRSLRLRQRGMTMVELLVAMTIGMVVSIAAVTMLMLGRSGYSTVDNTSMLIDRERFTLDLMGKVIGQAGYEDFGRDPPVLRSYKIKEDPSLDPEPDIFGWNNAIYSTPTSATLTTSSAIADSDRPTKCGSLTDTSCLNGSDVLAIRFQGSSVPGTASADNTVVNCLGVGEASSDSLERRVVNVFYIQRDSNTLEPSLYCAYYNHATSAWVAQPLIEGVEAMQVMYGTDNVTPLTAPAAALGDFLVDRWLRADQLKVSGNTAATRENFRRVRSVRVGLVLRGPRGSAPEVSTMTIAPLGSPSYVVSADAGTSLTTSPDTRLRRVVNFTVHLRNDLSTR
jgi:type IV pilus assembly protein PilW